MPFSVAKTKRIRWKGTLLSAGLYALVMAMNATWDAPHFASISWVIRVHNSVFFNLAFFMSLFILSWFRRHGVLEWLLVAIAMFLGASASIAVLDFLYDMSWLFDGADVWDFPLALLTHSLLMLLLILFSKLPVWGFLLSRHAWRRWKARREAR